VIGPPVQLATQVSKEWAVRKKNVPLLDTLTLTSDWVIEEELTTEELADSIACWLSTAADMAVPKKPKRPMRRRVHWWNADIDGTRRRCLQARRKYQRQRVRLGVGSSLPFLDRWRELRKSLSTVIKSAKEKSWVDLIASVDGDVWGKPYKTVMRRLKTGTAAYSMLLPHRVICGCSCGIGHPANSSSGQGKVVKV